MCMHDSTLECRPSLSPSQIADLRLAALQMSGLKRRAFEAEMTLKYCGGAPTGRNPFGWGRQTVALGLAERRTGFICLGAQAAFSGRKRWEDQHPQAAAALRRLAARRCAAQDPTFRTSLTYTRLTAQAALQALRRQGYSAEHLPSPSTWPRS